VDAHALRAATRAQCFFVGKRAGRRSVRQETINRLMIRAARKGKRVVRLKGGDPFVFGRGGEEALELAMAGVACEIVPGVSSAIAAPALAGIPVTHRGVTPGFLVLSGHNMDAFDRGIQSVQPNAVSLIVMMGLAGRARLADGLVARGWNEGTPAAIVCAASMPDQWVWTGPLSQLQSAEAPEGLAGVLVIGEVVRVGEMLAAREQSRSDNEVSYGRNG
jgi:uroporphyrin-III C-methyltransferase/precorrin-2 dehydrogenase/sirohydrochlorin ferrochelatase